MTKTTIAVQKNWNCTRYVSEFISFLDKSPTPKMYTTTRAHTHRQNGLLHLYPFLKKQGYTAKQLQTATPNQLQSIGNLVASQLKKILLPHTSRQSCDIHVPPQACQQSKRAHESIIQARELLNEQTDGMQPPAPLQSGSRPLGRLCPFFVPKKLVHLFFRTITQPSKTEDTEHKTN